MRTPTAKGFCSMGSPRCRSMVTVSRALCPMAKMAWRQGISLSTPPLTVRSAVSAPFRITQSVTVVNNRTSPPRSSISCRSRRTACRSRSVPMWGFACHRMAWGAPAAAKLASTSRLRGSLMPELSLPSEKAPAPPSPNWTLFWVSSTPVRRKVSTAA